MYVFNGEVQTLSGTTRRQHVSACFLNQLSALFFNITKMILKAIYSSVFFAYCIIYTHVIHSI